jgi:hypothetical protein
MRASLSYEKLFVKKREGKEFQTLADVRACILDPRSYRCPIVSRKELFWARQMDTK